MPTYEYACRDCGQHLEVVQSFKDPSLTTCGSCGGALRKVFSAAGIIFKGSGYYVTDTRSKQSDSSGNGSASPAKSEPKKSTGDTAESSSSGPGKDSGTEKGGAAESA